MTLNIFFYRQMLERFDRKWLWNSSVKNWCEKRCAHLQTSVGKIRQKMIMENVWKNCCEKWCVYSQTYVGKIRKKMITEHLCEQLLWEMECLFTGICWKDSAENDNGTPLWKTAVRNDVLSVNLKIYSLYYNTLIVIGSL